MVTIVLPLSLRMAAQKKENAKAKLSSNGEAEGVMCVREAELSIAPSHTPSYKHTSLILPLHCLTYHRD
ncbi:uncharacterized protein G2W53_031186 [Senna tora]|uniref:Uncharacterized protein n=1 Tax=Senna tora TaxID=362788 RepID=A0A834TAC1_9FABA|nr:uncharacterized protein G2W53_031186 [Senna tora]